MSEVIVFYAGQVHWEYPTQWEFSNHRRRSLIDAEIYNGAYVYYRHPQQGRHWYRMDDTPCLLEDVPKALRAWALIL